MHIFPNISRSKANQTLKFGQVKEYNKRNIFVQNLAENDAGRLDSDLFFKKKKFI